MRCDCGCGLGHDEDAGDDVTDWCIEEAVMIAYDIYLEREQRAEEQAEQEVTKRPGEITDPVMQEAMRRAKEIHFLNTGVRT